MAPEPAVGVSPWQGLPTPLNDTKRLSTAPSGCFTYKSVGDREIVRHGADFTYTIRGRWGDEDYLDLMKAIDLVVVRPDVDSTRMDVTGGSYGGFMTGWITTKNRRFAAAQVDRADMNWASWYGGSDQAQGLTESELYGKPWEKGNIYDAVSPTSSCRTSARRR